MLNVHFAEACVVITGWHGILAVWVIRLCDGCAKYFGEFVRL